MALESEARGPENQRAAGAPLPAHERQPNRGSARRHLGDAEEFAETPPAVAAASAVEVRSCCSVARTSKCGGSGQPARKADCNSRTACHRCNASNEYPSGQALTVLRMRSETKTQQYTGAGLP